MEGVKIRRDRPGFFTVTCDLRVRKEFTFLLGSDLHTDSVDFMDYLLASDLEEAKKRDALFFAFGDIFSATNSRYDPRRAAEELRPDLLKTAYFNALVDVVAGFLKPWEDQIALLTTGNHETAAMTHSGVDLLDLLSRKLESRPLTGEYQGYIHFLFKWSPDKVACSKLLRFHHGGPGGGPVTKHAIDFERMATYYHAPDVIVQGHTHRWDYDEREIERVSLTGANKGRMYDDIKYFVNLPCYVNEYYNKTQGWPVPKKFKPPSFGGAWLKFTHYRTRAGKTVAQGHAMLVDISRTYTPEKYRHFMTDRRPEPQIDLMAQAESKARDLQKMLK